MRPRLVVAACVFLVPVAALIFVLHPVCVPLTAEDLKTFNVPIEQRTDRDFYLKVFQKRDGQWYQCKTWISRFVFF
ncbi:MAG TPA: hypothetical protein VGV12_06245 [Gemmatimonadales bacterium]|nr:hypothetical protein [Gemmatimonadales bacterium]